MRDPNGGPQGYGDIWRAVVLLSLCGFFEIYEIALTSALSPGLIHAGVFKDGPGGLFGLTDQAAFAGAMFAGLFVGTSTLASSADRFGRRRVLIGSLLGYVAASTMMAWQNTAAGIDFWRFVAGVGVGIQLVTIDSYIAEMVPRELRGRAFAVNYGLMYLAAPVAGLLTWLLLPRAPFGIAGWRYVALFPVCALVMVWRIRRALPESPRWLQQRLRSLEPEPVRGDSGLAELFRPPYRRRTLMLLALNIFQALGFYGFTIWVPALLVAQGIDFVKSLQYSGVIALMYPLTPLACVLIADRIERKWQIVVAAAGIAVFGLLFAQQHTPGKLVVLGSLLVVSNVVLSYAYHAYQAELYPTRIRARAVGFVYSFSRLATIFSGFVIAIALRDFGTTGVFVFIAFCMLVVMAVVGALGPRTAGRMLEEMSP